ncbi:MAG: cytochrome ubiquinol oxidase subunit I, partial [Xanthobacteraceae bacterium]|nr:cytochrome ubiquinol oxidase subunit I [Xanthobacteraceae bacterium]
PVVDGPTPLWSARDALPALGGVRSDRREVLLTTPVEAAADIRWALPDPSLWPLVGALTLTVLFVGSIFTPWAVVWGTPPVGVALVGWFWPKGTLEDET